VRESSLKDLIDDLIKTRFNSRCAAGDLRSFTNLVPAIMAIFLFIEIMIDDIGWVLIELKLLY